MQMNDTRGALLTLASCFLCSRLLSLPLQRLVILKVDAPRLARLLGRSGNRGVEPLLVAG